VPHHPSLKEVIEKECGYEWLTLDICGFFIGDFADSENGKGKVSSPSFSLASNKSESEYGTYSFHKSSISIVQASEVDLNNLKGKFPLGSVNFYDEELASISIALSEKIYCNLINLLCHNTENLVIKVAIPKWHDKDCKCLPLIKYQVTYHQGGASEI
jgi:hypothetical protein